jgi:hypothetical protein
VTTSFEELPATGILYVAADQNGKAKRMLPCTVCEMASKHLTIRAEEGMRPSSPVSVEFNDTLFLGEVIACSRVPEGWTANVRVEQVLTDLQGLLVLRARLLGEPVPDGAEALSLSSRN